MNGLLTAAAVPTSPLPSSGHLIHLVAAAVPMLGLAGYVAVASLRAAQQRRGAGVTGPPSATPQRTVVELPAGAAPPAGADQGLTVQPPTPAWSRRQTGVFLPAPRAVSDPSTTGSSRAIDREPQRPSG